MRRLLLFAVLASISLTTHGWAQIEAPEYSGSFTVDGSPYSGGPILWFSLARVSSGGLDPSVSSVTLVPQANVPNNTRGRTVFRFLADGTGDLSQVEWMLPTGNGGNMSVAQAGETRYFSTWTSGWCIAPSNNDSFRSSVTVLDPETEAWVEIDVQEAPRPFLENIDGTFTHTTLDNGSNDLDDTAGKVLINKFLTPNIELEFELPTFDMRRTNVFWQDFSETSSPFWDQTYSRMVVAFDGPEGFYTFAGPISDLVMFAPGEGDSVKSIAGFGGTMDLDLSMIRPGEYTVRYWAIPLTSDFADGTGTLGCEGGFIPLEHTEMNVTVVPEPTTWLALSLGGAGLARRRRKTKA